MWEVLDQNKRVYADERHNGFICYISYMSLSGPIWETHREYKPKTIF